MVKIKDTQFCVKNLKMKRKKGQKIFMEGEGGDEIKSRQEYFS